MRRTATSDRVRPRRPPCPINITCPGVRRPTEPFAIEVGESEGSGGNQPVRTYTYVYPEFESENNNEWWSWFTFYGFAAPNACQPHRPSYTVRNTCPYVSTGRTRRNRCGRVGGTMHTVFQFFFAIVASADSFRAATPAVPGGFYTRSRPR